MRALPVHGYKSDFYVSGNYSCGLSGLGLYCLIAYLAQIEHTSFPSKDGTLCTVLNIQLATS